MPHPDQENPFDASRYRDPDAELGGADAVEKTTYVVGEGTDPNAIKGEGPAATVPSRGASGAVLAVILVLIALVVIAYLLGMGR